jgi:hypothetical protein
MVLIPFQPFSNFRQSLLIEEVVYILDFQWNTRNNSWYMSIFDADLILIIAGLRLSVLFDLTYKYRYIHNIPTGVFYVIPNNSNDLSELKFDSFTNESHGLYYLTKEEFNAL